MSLWSEQAFHRSLFEQQMKMLALLVAWHLWRLSTRSTPEPFQQIYGLRGRV